MSGIGDRIRARREELGLTQEELATRLGYKSKSSINKIETGNNNLPMPKVDRRAQKKTEPKLRHIDARSI